MKDHLFQDCASYIRAHSESSEARREPGPVITISRETGAGGFSIAEMVAEELRGARKDWSSRWTVFDRNLIERVLSDHELPERLREFMPEDARLNPKHLVEEFLGLHPSLWTLAEHVTETVLRLAQAGNVILVGHGSAIITAGMRNVLHVRLVAPFEERVQNAGKSHALTHEEAATLVRKTDRARKRYVRRYFNADIDDPLHFHLIVNTGKIPFPAAAKLIAGALLAHAGNRETGARIGGHG
jgi:cytidylate kinase